MFPKSNSFYLTGLIKVLYEIWHILYLYPFDVIAMKTGAKWRIAFLHINIAKKSHHCVEIALILEKKYCLIGII